MKNLMNLKNAKILSKKEQKSINGGNGPASQYDCEQLEDWHWACVGATRCSCVYDGPVDPPIQ